MNGKVYLVGAGPGDPALITQKGADLLKRAGCVIYDRLVSSELLKIAPRRSERIYAGKSSHEGGQEQGRINRLLVQKARRHRVVVRLKGGDPSVFGRLGEELGALQKAHVPFEVVPGVSSIWAAAAAAGIPLTDRRLSSSVAFVTGRPAAGNPLQATSERRAVRWKELARAADTLVILMGSSALPKIVREIQRGGRPGSTPIALIRWVSTPEQELFVSTLDKVEAELRRRPRFGPPVVAIIGEVVGTPPGPISEKSWGGRSLEGRKVLITRPAADSVELTRRLEGKGARCVHLPTIEVRPRRLPAAEEKSLLKRLPEFDWVLFNSHHAVESLAGIARRRGRSLKGLLRGKICAIGPRTEETVRAAGLVPARIPEESSVAGVRKAFGKTELRGKKVLIPRSNLGVGDPLAQALRQKGATAEEIAIYETAELRVPHRRLKAALRGLDAATFTSASTARAFLRSVRFAHLPLGQALNGAAVVAIGPSTAQALRKGGVRRVVLPEREWSLEGLVQAVENAVGSP